MEYPDEWQDEYAVEYAPSESIDFNLAQIIQTKIFSMSSEEVKVRLDRLNLIEKSNLNDEKSYIVLRNRNL